MGLFSENQLDDYGSPPELMSYELDNLSNQSLPPIFISTYLWDACRRGRLFDFRTYERDTFARFVNSFVQKIIEDVPFPAHFTKERVVEIFMKKLMNSFDKSETVNSLESVNANNVESVKNLTKKSRKEGEMSFSEFVNFLKQDMFPPILWMEFVRFQDVFVDTMEFMMERLERWFRLSPTRLSRIAERNRLTRAMVRPYAELSFNYISVALSLLQIFLFMELWGCEKESELFTEKLWTFEKVDLQAFEKIFFRFHNSINELQRSILKHKPEKMEIDFSKPTDWAFKQLVKMVEV